MTKKEMTEIFSLMLMAWPNAEIFKGGQAKLRPTVLFWHSCLKDIDFVIGQRAIVGLCKTNKFPPSIAEFREKATAITAQIQSDIGLEWNYLCADLNRGKSIGEIYREMPTGSIGKKAIDAMGGPENLYMGDAYGPHVERTREGQTVFSYVNFEKAYKKAVYYLAAQKTQIEQGGGKPALERSREHER